eukprot:283489-Chlamydomonas_euryale.AAC.3
MLRTAGAPKTSMQQLATRHPAGAPKTSMQQLAMRLLPWFPSVWHLVWPLLHIPCFSIWDDRGSRLPGVCLGDELCTSARHAHADSPSHDNRPARVRPPACPADHPSKTTKSHRTGQESARCRQPVARTAARTDGYDLGRRLVTALAFPALAEGAEPIPWLPARAFSRRPRSTRCRRHRCYLRRGLRAREGGACARTSPMRSSSKYERNHLTRSRWERRPNREEVDGSKAQRLAWPHRLCPDRQKT